MMKLILILITNALVFGLVESAEIWKSTSDKVVDIGIVMDQNPLGLNFDPTGAGNADAIWYNDIRVLHKNRDVIAKLVQHVIAGLVETKTSDVNASIAIMFHDRGNSRLDQSFEQTKGRNAEDIAMALKQFDVEVFPNRVTDPRLEKKSVDTARSQLAQAAGNRPGVPDLLIWIGLHITPTKFEELDRLRQISNGPDLVICVYSTESQTFKGGMVGNGIPNKEIDWDNVPSSEIVKSIHEILATCSMEMQETPCYFKEKNETCVLDKMYRPKSQNATSEFRYCVNGTLENSCQLDECHDNCNKAERETTGQCSVTCGDGWKKTRPKGYLTDKFVKYCPVKNEACNVECSVGTDSPMTPGESSKLKTWQIILIIFGCGFAILFVVCLVVFFLCLCKKAESRPPTPPDGTTITDTDQSTNVTRFDDRRRNDNKSPRFSFQSRGSPHHIKPQVSPTSPHRHHESNASPRRGSAKFVELSKESVKVNVAKKTSGPYIDLANEKQTGYREMENVQWNLKGYREM